MIFLTVGTLFLFNRLVRAVDKAIETGLIQEKVVAQVGKNSYIPRNMEYVESIDKEGFERKMTEASYVISHAGMGNIIIALKYKKPLLVMPRLKMYDEHINDHQLGIAKQFGERGYILVAYDENELIKQVVTLMSFRPKPIKSNPKLIIEKISQYLQHLEN